MWDYIPFKFNSNTYLYDDKKERYYLEKNKSSYRQIFECFCCCNFYDEDFVYHVRLKKVPQELKDEAAKYKPKYEVSYIKNRNLHMSNLERLNELLKV